MLGVRRASVTEVLRPLQDEGLIRASRGKVVILDPKRLADASCECYGVIRGSISGCWGETSLCSAWMPALVPELEISSTTTVRGLIA